MDLENGFFARCADALILKCLLDCGQRLFRRSVAPPRPDPPCSLPAAKPRAWPRPPPRAAEAEEEDAAADRPAAEAAAGPAAPPHAAAAAEDAVAAARREAARRASM